MENVIVQVESTARIASSTSTNQNSEDLEKLLPITVRPFIVNKEPDFNGVGMV